MRKPQLLRPRTGRKISPNTPFCRDLKLSILQPPVFWGRSRWGPFAAPSPPRGAHHPPPPPRSGPRPVRNCAGTKARPWAPGPSRGPPSPRAPCAPRSRRCPWPGRATPMRLRSRPARVPGSRGPRRRPHLPMASWRRRRPGRGQPGPRSASHPRPQRSPRPEDARQGPARPGLGVPRPGGSAIAGRREPRARP